MKKTIIGLLFSVLSILFIPVTSYAAEAPPLKSPERILWAAKCAGPMPKLLSVSLAVIFALIIISVIYYRKGDKKDEQ